MKMIFSNGHEYALDQMRNTIDYVYRGEGEQPGSSKYFILVNPAGLKITDLIKSLKEDFNNEELIKNVIFDPEREGECQNTFKFGMGAVVRMNMAPNGFFINVIAPRPESE